MTLSCERCKENTYPVISAGGKRNITTSIDKIKGHMLENLENTILKCQNCPTGGSCKDGAIKARDNFYGFVNEEKEYMNSYFAREIIAATQKVLLAYHRKLAISTELDLYVDNVRKIISLTLTKDASTTQNVRCIANTYFGHYSYPYQ